MSFNSTVTATVVASVLMTTAAFAGDVTIKDSYARSATPTSPTGAAFMMLMNNSDHDVKLIGVSSEAAKRTELHTHIDNGDGVMKMGKIEGGIVIPAGEMHMMKRGGDHVMLMGLVDPLVQGEAIAVTFEFEKSDPMTVEIPVDNERKPEMDHSGH